MRKLGLIAIALTLLGLARPALSAQIVGKINDYQGTPISNIQVAITDRRGRQVMSLVTDKNGIFDATNLAPGDYGLQLHPFTGGLLGRPIQLHLSPTGATVRWTVVPADPYLL